MQPSERDEIRDLLKRTAVALKQGDVPFALCGGYAAWVRGAPEPDHDADFLVPDVEADRAAKVLADAGLEVQEPPEDWLIKVYRDDLCIDVIHALSSGEVTPELLSRADELPVESVVMPVLSATDLLVGKLSSLSEHACDLEPVLAVARSLRGQVDVGIVREACRDHPYAEAALFLIRKLEILPELEDIA